MRVAPELLSAVEKKAAKVEEKVLKPTRKVSTARQKRFHRRFKDVPESEPILDYFACAILTDKFMRQGMIYITQSYFAFYSNFLGYVTKILTPIERVTDVRRKKKSRWQINTITLHTVSEKYDFTNFINYETAFEAIKSRVPDEGVEADEQIAPEKEDEGEDKDDDEDDASLEFSDGEKSLQSAPLEPPKVEQERGLSRFLVIGMVGVLLGMLVCLFLSLRISSLEHRLTRIRLSAA